MKKIIVAWFSVASIFASVFAGSVSAAVIYIPTASSSQYLPTVKIVSYSLSYDGAVVPSGGGSGTLIDGSGTVLTNNHVIQSIIDPSRPEDAFQICLTKSNDVDNPVCEFTASLIARDSAKDIALLKINGTDVRGNSLVFNFNLSYENAYLPDVGSSLTVIGYPGIGGKTVTYTSGVVSGYLDEAGVKYIKTDAEISFGNSGGTAVDKDGNFVGIPTLISGDAGGSIGYLLPVKNIKDWVKSSVSGVSVSNDSANSKLRDSIYKNVKANESGVYRNDYPPYQISLVNGWEFEDTLASMASTGGYSSGLGSSVGGVVMKPKDKTTASSLSVTISVNNYAYAVSLDDIEYNLSSSVLTGSTAPIREKVNFNEKYFAIKETASYYDWYGNVNVNAVAYHIPYGDKEIVVTYSYGDSDSSRLPEVDKILATFSVDMSKVSLSVVNEVKNIDPKVVVGNLIDNVFLSDGSYTFDGEKTFLATFGKKKDKDFYISVNLASYWDPKYVGNFDLFKKDTFKDAKQFYSVLDQGDIEIDGHSGFFYSSEYAGALNNPDSTVKWFNIYVNYAKDKFLSVYYSSSADKYDQNTKDFRSILKNIQLDNNGGGKYSIPGFGGSVPAVLSDIKDYVYEENIKNINKLGAFGDSAPSKFDPEAKLKRKNFVVWAARTLSGTPATDFAAFKKSYSGCDKDCFSDVNYGSTDSMYIEFARKKGAVSGSNVKGKLLFNPENDLSLPAALKILFKLYDVKVWKAPDFIPWYMPYLQLGYKKGLMPYGVNKVDYVLSRGEGAYMLDAMNVSVSSGMNMLTQY
ncbi:serine protease [Candidatus Peregrinibacteria bacterium]|nr:serine protease [Candidatus Peregrinibacteria bacterium]